VPFRLLTAASEKRGWACHTGPMSPRRAALAVPAGAPLAGALLAGTLLLGACGSGAKSASHGATEDRTATSATTAAAPRVTLPSALTTPECTVVDAALVSQKLGFALTGPNVDRGPTATICTYDNPSNQAQTATVQITSGATAASFASGRNGFASHREIVTDVPGLGDEAYQATLTVANITNTTLVARTGGTEVLITTTAPADRVSALMTAVLALV
jgi:hypothetical protein